MAVYWTPYVTLVITTDIYASGDALGAKATFNNVPEHGKLMAISVIDRASQAVNLDLVLFKVDIAGTADNAAFDPTDTELQDCVGAVLVNTWKAFNDNSLGIVTNIGMPYWTPAGKLYFQCVTRGTPTYAAVDDVRVAIAIEH